MNKGSLILQRILHLSRVYIYDDISLNAWSPLKIPLRQMQVSFLWRRRQSNAWCFQKESFVSIVKSLANRDWYKLTCVMKWIWQNHPSLPYTRQSWRCFFLRCCDCYSPITATKLCLFSVAMITTFSQVLPTSIQTLQLEGSDIRTFLLNL